MRQKITTVFLALALTVFLLSLSVVVTLNFRPLYYSDIANLDIPGISGLTETKIRENYDALIDYNSVFYKGELEFPSLAMSPEGKIHFEEVKNIFVGIQLAVPISGLLVFLGFFFKRKRRDYGFLKLGSILTVVLPCVLGALIAANWQWFFVAFHKMAFRNDYWIFDPAKDPVITILPDAFFMHCALMILGLTLALTACTFLLWRWLHKKTDQADMNALQADNSALKTGEVIDVLRRSLSVIDPRLMEHGDRVTFMMYETLRHAGKLRDFDLEKLCVLGVFHDIGAEKVDEIDEMTKITTAEIMEHSVYGYVFLKNLSPLGDYAQAILYHHMNFDHLRQRDCPFADYAQLINLCDRVDVMCQHRHTVSYEWLRSLAGTVYREDFVELFIAADKECHIIDRCESGAYREYLNRVIHSLHFTAEEVLGYLKMLVFTIDFVSAYTATHTINIQYISTELAKQLGVSGQELDKISYAAVLHDIGKIAIPPSILESPGKLTAEEMEIMKSHVIYTDDILKGVVPDEIRQIAARHHEKLDGSGYPKGLTAGDLTQAERIMAVADVFSALIGVRSYKDSFPKERVISILSDMRDKGQLDPEICNTAISGYDAIAEEANQKQQPVVALYEKILAEYREVKEQLLSEENTN